MLSIQFVECVALFFRAMQHLKHFFVLGFELHFNRIQYDLNYSSALTMRLSCTRMISHSPEFPSF
jgi:hypothetical protein